VKQIQKYEELESLRGIAALLVVLVHIPNFNPILNLNFFMNLHLMVDLFFVLSGFVIYTAYADRIKTKAQLLKFQFLRFGRLYPIHILFLILFLGFEIARYILNLTGHSFSNSHAFEKNNLVAFVEHLFLLQSFHPGHSMTFNFVSWSISVEFYTYILFGLIVLYCQQYKNHLFLIIAIFSIALLVYGVGPDLWHVLRCTSGFFIGCLTAKFLKDYHFSFSAYFSFIAFAVLFFFVAINKTSTYTPLIYLISAVLIFCLVANPGGGLNQILKTKPLVYLGTVSYSMYMSHVSVLYIANYLVKIYRAPTFQSKDGQMIPYLDFFELSVYTVLSVALVFLISHLLYQYVEKPFRTRSRELSDTLKVMN
jgi:peptidoglycan/LPS O-acetylase OafA/YrhL